MELIDHIFVSNFLVANARTEVSCGDISTGPSDFLGSYFQNCSLALAFRQDSQATFLITRTR